MDLSIVIPVYNSEKIIGDLIEKITDSISDIKLVNSYEIILVNDCSADSSWEKIKFLAKKFTFIKAVNEALYIAMKRDKKMLCYGL